ncbi:MAG: hypothetical protein BHW31_06850 [Firmicutes bacterium CAG:110_56_8]|nr:MAG: hypothetical protein BHW31_06850 [Firmicutes bacterium CAG:110_56_8]
MNGKELLLGLSYISPKYIEEAKNHSASQKRIRFRKPLLIAAVIALTLLLVGCAVAAYARIHMRLVQHNVPTTAQTDEDVPDATPARSVIASCYPRQLPEGYRLAEGSPLNHTTRNLCYRNDAGKMISFTISTSQAIEGVLAPPREETSFTVSGWDAVLQTSEKGAQTLSWHNEADGYYAGLFTQDMAVDLKAVAESVDSGEELPMSFLCRQGKIWNIWYPRQIPEGYACTDVAPCGNGGQEIRYTCDASGSVISYHVSLTTDLSAISDPPRDSCVWEELPVAGQPARMMTTSSGLRLLFWKNEQEGFNAMLSVEDDAVDILAMAESAAPGEPLEVTSNYLGPDYTIELEQDASSYVGWEPVYPQSVPEGYEITFVAEPAYGEQSIDYENDAGDTLTYTLYFRLSQWGRQFDGMGQPEQVKINGNVGYKSPGELVWTDAARGFGFSLRASGDVDLIAVAESVGIGPELKPTRWDDIRKALEQLGDYQITALPDGMVEDGLTGAPLENADDWYSYVRRWYFDPKTNQDIYLEYVQVDL